ncbi:MerR family transcriptional regulator [Leifsonia sp. TF02-11]|uniref:MerR family transcriptional regulator n=1 Tax=Leifsonia sp. TF02-11 TaxID=2815212 RepID=UPI001AA17480|nr:MerR family transcriptional regulator [Leifsonia sp. TF02-11]MBO1741633.1 MerR family transcriptional regulator [Leifsonia sp. TF02-11]
MLISELSERTGTPSATIKYYVREGLLPAGERVGGNRTIYGEEHARRLKLIRAMLEVGKLSVAAVRTVLEALDEPGAPVAHAFDAAQQAVSRSAVPDVAPPSPSALERVDAVVDRAGWADCGDNIGRGIAAQVIDAFDNAGFPLPDDYLDSYAAAARLQAEADLTTVGVLPDPARMTELVVVGTVLGDTLALGLRRMAQAVVTSERSMQ